MELNDGLVYGVAGAACIWRRARSFVCPVYGSVGKIVA